MAVIVETLKQILDEFSRLELDAIISRFVEDCTFDFLRGPNPWGERYTGKSEVPRGFARRFKGIPDVHYREDRHWVAGERGVSEWL